MLNMRVYCGRPVAPAAGRICTRSLGDVVAGAVARRLSNRAWRAAWIGTGRPEQDAFWESFTVPLGDTFRAQHGISR